MKKMLLAVLATLTIAAVALPASAQINVFPVCSNTGPQTANTEICRATNAKKLFGAGSIWNNILNIFTMIIGAVSVLMIIIGGFKYVTSQGDQSAIGSAKNTILYAVIGLIVAVMSGAIVNFVLVNI